MSYKKLIIVGNASSILNQKKGNLIDEFDVVLRTGSFQIKGYEKYVGTKTDIYYTPINCFFGICKHTSKLIFRPPLIHFNFNNILFLETDPRVYQEMSLFGSNWGISGIPIPKAAAGEIFFNKIHKSTQYIQRVQNKSNDIILYEYLLSQFFKKYGDFNYEYYDGVVKFNLFKKFNSVSLSNSFSVPSRGMYAIWHAINFYKDYQIYVTGFDGLQTRNYWQPVNYEKDFEGHSTYKEKRMYKFFLKNEQIHEL